MKDSIEEMLDLIDQSSEPFRTTQNDSQKRNRPIRKGPKNSERMKENGNNYHHPMEKINQLNETVERFNCRSFFYGEILEVFGGDDGHLTPYYEERGVVTTLNLKTTGDSYDYVHTLRGKKKEYDVIDIDPYSDPYDVLEPCIGMMKEKTLLLLTVPRYYPRSGFLIADKKSTWGTSSMVTEGNVVATVWELARHQGFTASPLDIRPIGHKNGGIIRSIFYCNHKGRS